MSDRPSGAAPPRLVAVLGPTNTGKTHLAVERMLGHASGMIGLPLRLTIGERSLKEGGVEFKLRDRDERWYVPLDCVITEARRVIEELLAPFSFKMPV